MPRKPAGPALSGSCTLTEPFRPHGVLKSGAAAGRRGCGGFLALGRPLAWDDVGTPLKPGHTVQPYRHLVSRIDPKQIDQLLEPPAEPKAEGTRPAGPETPEFKLEPVEPPKPPVLLPVGDTISIDDFGRIDLRVARIVDAELVADADKLVKLTLDIGIETRTEFAGIRTAYHPRTWWAAHVIGQPRAPQDALASPRAWCSAATAARSTSCRRFRAVPGMPSSRVHPTHPPERPALSTIAMSWIARSCGGFRASGPGGQLVNKTDPRAPHAPALGRDDISQTPRPHRKPRHRVPSADRAPEQRNYVPKKRVPTRPRWRPGSGASRRRSGGRPQAVARGAPR